MTISLAPRNGTRSRGRRFIATLGAIALAAAVALSASGAPANADEGAQLTAAPASITAGQTTTVTATGLGGLQQATFGLDDTPGGSFTETGAASYQAAVSGGRATATFTARQAGTFTIAVGTGESALATLTVVVRAAAPAPAPAPHPSAPPVAISAQPTQVEAGQSSTLSATGLGELRTVTFGTDAAGGVTFLPSDQTSQQSTVTAGTATAEFVAEEPGTYTVVVSTGESVLASTTVVVSAAPQPSPTVISVDTPSPGAPTWTTVWVVAGLAALVIVAGGVTWVVTARRRRRSAGAARS